MDKTVVIRSSVTFMIVIAGSAAAQTIPANFTLEEVTVTSRIRKIVHEVDGTIYDLQDNLQANSGSVSDVLNTLPLVNVAPNGNVSVRGSSVAVLIDGKPSPLLRGMSLADALQSMSANSVAKIEVITNPGPEFRMNAGTVINLITRKQQSATSKGDVTINAGARGRLNGSLSGSNTTGKWSFNGNTNLRKDLRYDIWGSELIARDPDGSRSSREIEHRPTYVPFTATSASIAASYVATDRDTFMIGSEGALNHRPRRFVDYRTSTDPDGTVTSDSITHDMAEQHYDHFSVTGDYVRKELFGSDTLKMKLMHEDYDTRRDSTDVERFITPTLPDNVYRQLRVERQLIDTLSGDYIFSATKDREFKAGFEVEGDRDSSSHTVGTEIFDADEVARFRLDRTLLVAYANYQLSRGKWTIKGGLRGEDLVSRFAQDTAPSTTLHDLQWSPNISIERELTSDATLSFNYTRRIDRPTTDQLNPLRTVVASITGTGNPYLKPGETQSIDIGYRYVTTPITLSSVAYFRWLNNQIVTYRYAPIPGDTALVSNYENAGKGTATGVELSMTLRASTDWSINLSSDLSHAQQTAPLDGIDVTNSTYTHLTKLGVAWTPDPDDSLQAQVQLHGRTLLAGGMQSGYGSLNFSYGHTFTPKLKLVGNINDLLNTVRYQESIDTAQYQQRWQLRVPGRVFYVGLNYKLGAVTVKK